MKKKTALIWTSLLMLTLLLTTPSYIQQPAAAGTYKYNIKLSQLCCNAKINGSLTLNDVAIARFRIGCNQSYAEVKVKTASIPNDIEFILEVDWDKNGIYEDKKRYEFNSTSTPRFTIPFTWSYKKTVGGVKKMVTVEVTEITGPLHWKIMLAQKHAIAWLNGSLTENSIPTPCTDFALNCDSNLPCENFKFKKVVTPNCTIPNDIELTLHIEWKKTGGMTDIPYVKFNMTQFPWQKEWLAVPGDPEMGMVVVEVEEHDYDPADVWQFTVKQENCNVIWTGWLTNKTHVKISGSDFHVECNWPTQMQCNLTQIPWCTEPYDIHHDLIIKSKNGPVIWQHLSMDNDTTQFPWKFEKVGWDPYNETWYKVELELTEVQMHRYIVMGGQAPNCAQLSVFDPMYWNVPFATRPPDYTPYQEQSLNITFTQRDPITGIVKLSIPGGGRGFLGVNHVFYSNSTNQYYNVSTFTLEQGCGYLFTGQGKNPIYGDVDLTTWNNDTGVYTYGPDGKHTLITMRLQNITFVNQTRPVCTNWTDTYDYHLESWVDYDISTTLSRSDRIVLKQLPGGPSRLYEVLSYEHGAICNLTVRNKFDPDGTWADDKLIELGPCLKEISGPDGIPGTGDPGDIFGDGITDPNGSSVLYLPAIVHSDWSLPGLPKPNWQLLYEAPYPNLYITTTANDTVFESACAFGNFNASASGQPWEFIAGLDHPDYCHTYWKHEKCNAYVTYACAWSMLNIPTELGDLDLLWKITYKLVRGDCVVMDISGDELVDIEDVVTCAISFGGKDETYGRWKAYKFIALGDVAPSKGEIDIGDIVTIAIDFGAKLTPECILGRRL